RSPRECGGAVGALMTASAPGRRWLSHRRSCAWARVARGSGRRAALQNYVLQPQAGSEARRGTPTGQGVPGPVRFAPRRVAPVRRSSWIVERCRAGAYESGGHGRIIDLVDGRVTPNFAASEEQAARQTAGEAGSPLRDRAGPRARGSHVLPIRRRAPRQRRARRALPPAEIDGVAPRADPGPARLPAVRRRRRQVPPRWIDPRAGQRDAVGDGDPPARAADDAGGRRLLARGGRARGPGRARHHLYRGLPQQRRPEPEPGRRFTTPAADDGDRPG